MPISLPHHGGHFDEVGEYERAMTHVGVPSALFSSRRMFGILYHYFDSPYTEYLL